VSILWADEEEKVLRKLWGKGIGTNEISQVLNRSNSAIKRKIDSLGIRNNRPPQYNINYDLLKLLIGEEADAI